MRDEFKTGNPIWIYYRDIDNNDNLRLPQLLRGHLGQSYEIKKIKIPNYTLMQTTGTLQGVFDDTAKSVCFYYRKTRWGEIDDSVHYLYLKQPVTVYDQVEGMPLGTPLPGGIYVKSFQRIATTDRQFWNQVNAGQWLQFDDAKVKMVKDDPFKGDVPTRPVSDLTYLALNRVAATVDFLPERMVETYSTPYGQPSGKVANGQKLTLIGRLTDDNGVTWYKTSEQNYINGNYVKIVEED